MKFSSAARELYGVEPGDFVETRTRLVRRAKDEGDAALAERIGGLRRPTVSAWAVNLLARSAPDDLGRLLDVGDELRSAWGSGGGLGDLEQRRARLIDALLRTAEALAAEAGHPVRDQAVREIEDTLQAATVDADVAAEVREGTLSRPRSHTGFVPAGFPVAPGAGKPRAKPKGEEKEKKKEKEPRAEKTDRARGRAAARAETLRERAAEAERELAGRDADAAAARDAAERASAEVGRLRHELERAVADRDTAVRKAERAGQARDRADEAARRARAKADEAGRGARGR
ncbi:hypothetical protein [Actinomadura algeriensis]|uniref:Transposase n=1 Tax=Actinomadura algeriensis TaxID=1679523 RepID=A0ABR9JYT5_9ACTN|nr:hypothetical protein [Actinomadura algeriensis]MBE1535731.1 hypothetical protein [Actinomadura algeriensis]